MSVQRGMLRGMAYIEIHKAVEGTKITVRLAGDELESLYRNGAVVIDDDEISRGHGAKKIVTLTVESA